MRSFAKVASMLLALVLVSAFGARFAAQELIRWRSALRSSDAVDTLERVELGGVAQSVLLRGHDRNAPLLLWLHGGPGRPFLPTARDHPRELEQLFLIAYWAQRGTPGSNGRELEYSSLTMEQLISDTQQLIDHLRERFDRERIFLLGDSWGSALAAMVASRHPEGLQAYIGVANSICRCESDEYNIRYALSRARAENNRMAISELEPILRKAEASGAASATTAELVTVAQWIRHYGGYARSQPYDHSSRWSRAVPHGVLAIVASPDYNLGDLARFFRAPMRPFRTLFDDLGRYDLRRDAPRIDTPVYFLHGRHDGSTPLYALEDYLEKLVAPEGKQLILFEDSGHELLADEPEKFLQTLRQIAAAEAGAADSEASELR